MTDPNETLILWLFIAFAGIVCGALRALTVSTRGDQTGLRK